MTVFPYLARPCPESARPKVSNHSLFVTTSLQSTFPLLQSGYFFSPSVSGSTLTLPLRTDLGPALALALASLAMSLLIVAHVLCATYHPWTEYIWPRHLYFRKKFNG